MNGLVDPGCVWNRLIGSTVLTSMRRAASAIIQHPLSQGGLVSFPVKQTVHS